MIIRAERSLLIISNVQADLLWGIHEGERVIKHCCWMAAVARDLGIPILVTEHKRLGDTLPEVRELTAHAPTVEITTFSYLSNALTREKILETGRDQIILAGTETHISILQTAMDVHEAGMHPFVVEEACGSRDGFDADAAVPRMRRSGVEIVTREMVFFEWVTSSELPNYRELSLKYVKHPAPPPDASPAAK